MGWAERCPIIAKRIEPVGAGAEGWRSAARSRGAGPVRCTVTGVGEGWWIFPPSRSAVTWGNALETRHEWSLIRQLQSGLCGGWKDNEEC
ncbi:hypothetical protein chiPu_0005292 [Chiloscyllium punctatum]|uniref:Uncharacterized protein n=1 Tax=Chiloscyllium punctatum TaxID=137246 RepID=A0A401S902_CHIPU|nr:hypothetical protein [Chiloscyllium punctatum]